MIYWKYDNAIDLKTCKKIIKINKNTWENGKIGTCTKLPAKSLRQSQVSFTTDQWLYDIVFDYMRDANVKANWNFEISAAESMQITKYGVGGHYNYHIDGYGITPQDVPDNKFMHGKTRKLSMTINLNNEYEGGEFQFLDDKKSLIKEKRGTVIIFPSYMQHRVKPVKSGTRYSLVVWFLGKPFR
tara:strand:- start:587 stop:1141 length:555 start_codon:yes stop_codon:yes gene_type:complete